MSRDRETERETDRPGPRGGSTRGGPPKNVYFVLSASQSMSHGYVPIIPCSPYPKMEKA